MKNRLPLFSFLVASLVLFASTTTFADPAQVDFNRDIQPILSDNCYHCHGPDKISRKADLRFDREESVLEVKKGRAAIFPGKADQSELVRRILSKDKDAVMPPLDSNRTLSAPQIDTLTKWVEQGARWGKHWAYVAPVRPVLPEVKDANWGQVPIDRFILARLEKEGLKPSVEASKEKLIRRVTLDLTGLPPTPEEVDAFVADDSQNAYEKLVDRLFASPHYGERMVVDWLDASRYADSNGYQGDPIRTNWPWRDWVIKAMNDNMRFNQFVTEQLAGDLIPSAAQSQRVATAFCRNHTYNGEGGRIADETRVENVMDRTETFGTVFLGLTVTCTRCHDHKFDPIYQKEYYQLYAFFNQCSETGSGSYAGGGNAFPVMNYATAEQEQKLASAKTELAAAEKKLADAIPQVDAAQAEWEKTAAVATGEQPWIIVDPQSYSTKSGATLTKLDDKSLLASGTLPVTDEYDLVIKVDQTNLTGLRIEMLGDPSLPHGGPGRALENGNFVLSTIEGEAVSVADAKQSKPLAFNAALSQAEYSQPGWLVSGAVDNNPSTGWAGQNAPKKEIAAQFVFAQPVGFAGGTELRLRLKQEYASGNPPGQHMLGRFRISLTTQVVLPPPVMAALAISPDKRNDPQKQQVREHFQKNVSPLFALLSSEVETRRKSVTDSDNAMTKVMVMDDAAPRKTFVLSRGSYDKPDAEVQPGVPAILNPWPADAPKNRLGLAKWLTDPANPLMARVTVNRYWQSFFGTGLVKTAEDFGVQGEKPSHPELLDWLAVEFRESGWDVKKLQRLIVTSSAYRQSSRVTPDLIEHDPQNRLLARGPRYRLSSHQIRDAALAVSGLLVDQLGGAPVKTYQPAGVWEEMSLDQIHFEQDHGDKLWRRSLYTFWRRTVAPTIMFDVPARTVCSVRQTRTNTPLQALALMNDITYVEAARHLSETLLLDPGKNDDQRIERIFRSMTARKATDAERSVLTASLQRMRSQYKSDPAAATKLVSIGEKPRDAKLDVVELAAWTSLANMMMNLDEAITQE